MRRVGKHTKKHDRGRMIIFAAGWPKSGVTWLTRLLGDALDCPTGATTPEQDHKEVAAEGWERPGPYVVRKIHARLVDAKGGPVVPRPHHLAWRNLTDEHVVLILRDPRDISVSLAFYSEISLNRAIRRLHNWEWGSWQDYVMRWLNAEFDYTRTNYEALSKDAAAEVTRILEARGLPVDRKRIAVAVQRQSFDSRKEHIRQWGHKYARGRAFNLRFMRKGIVGDWRNHYTRAHGKMAETYWGEAMRLLGYTEDGSWWKELRR